MRLKQFLIVVVVLLTVALVVPSQAQKAVMATEAVTSIDAVNPCPCEETATTTPVLPQGETEQIQTIVASDDGTWGGDPDGFDYWMSYIGFVMDCVYCWGDCPSYCYNPNIIY